MNYNLIRPESVKNRPPGFDIRLSHPVIQGFSTALLPPLHMPRSTDGCAPFQPRQGTAHNCLFYSKQPESWHTI